MEFVAPEFKLGTKTELTQAPRDRPFNGFRIAKSTGAHALIVDVRNQIQNLEWHDKLRKRARKPLDQQMFERQIEALVCDLAHRELTVPGGKIAVPFSKRVLGSNDRYRPRVLGKTLPDVARKMARPEMEFAELEIGYQNPFLIDGNRQTMMRAGSRLRDRIIEHGLGLEDFGLEPSEEIIILKADKEDHFDKGKWIQYDDTPQTIAFREELGRINGWLERADLEYVPLNETKKAVDTSSRRLLRVFNNGSFEQGGRFFGGFWLSLPKDERRYGLLIDGLPIATLDYGQMCPRILYGLAGIQPHFEDAYSVPGLLDHRDGVKKVMNAMIHTGKPLGRLPQGSKAGLPRGMTVYQATSLIRDFHKPIAESFNTGVGLRLFYEESRILIKVLTRLMEQGIIALPIHDAVMVSEDHQEDTKDIMLSVFREFTGFEGVVGIEV